jgi:hypothetical protein
VGGELETAGAPGGRKPGRWPHGQQAMLKGGDAEGVPLATACDGTLATTAQFTWSEWCAQHVEHLSVIRRRVKVPHSTKFDAQEVRKRWGRVSTWDTSSPVRAADRKSAN